ncbi:hypothetical protein FHX48_002771 [Microbacterium halimionae]|uniref:Uncharacterized protein n=1 Tax=Microbacterium halimionae TaxID=1526413 RepID=A0A7W3JRK1_9MICO|nr:hypothetical protein [Microbacterium halimionae]MBA8817666.1 hypothetical protein [Microbacterium halimionae]NII94755.1 hypothetical protein [Microbacterium halimionae]
MASHAQIAAALGVSVDGVADFDISDGSEPFVAAVGGMSCAWTARKSGMALAVLP